jgi:hypothetical protein
MEPTNYVERAKSLMQKTARTTALVIVPLAAAVSAHAGAISALPTSNFSCVTIDNGASGGCSGGAVQLGASNGVAGVQLFTTGSISFSNSGGELILSTNGDISGGTLLSGTTLPLAWDFILSPTGTSDLIGWQLVFTLDVSGSPIGSFTTSGLGNGTITGTGSLQTTADASTNVSLIGDLTWTGDSNADTIDVSVPGGSSFDFNSPGGVPEPASTGLVAAGLAWLGWRLRKIRRR